MRKHPAISDTRSAKYAPIPFPKYILDLARYSGHVQPPHYSVLLYATHALISAHILNNLLSTYEDSMDSPVGLLSQGLMWKTERDSKWYLNWIDYPVGSEELVRYSLPIITEEMLHLLITD